MASRRIALAHSAQQPLRGAVPVAPADPGERFRVSLYLRRRSPLPDLFELGAQRPSRRHYLTSEKLEAKYGADPADVERVSAFAAEHGLQIVATNPARRCVTLQGTAAAYAAAFATRVLQFAHPGGIYRANEGPLHVPEPLDGIVVAVTGLDTRPVAQPSLARHPGVFHPLQMASAQAAAMAAAHQHMQARMSNLQQVATAGSDESLSQPGQTQQMYTELAQAWEEAQRQAALAAFDALGVKTPPQVARLYNFPEGTDGSGQTIAIIELAGGYQRQQLEAYFAFLGLPMPNVTDVSVGGAVNSPGQQLDADSEVVLDISVAGGAAPGANLVVYFAPNSPEGYIEAVHTALHDRANRPSVISISWDQAEGNWLRIPMLMGLFDDVLSEAAMLGVTVCCSSGDFGAYGSSPQQFDGHLQVDYPGSNPYVLACGGTTLVTQGNATIAEYAWNALQESTQATGGGVSQKYAVPPWQENAGVPQSANPGGGRGRGVPDVAGNADQRTGYLVLFNGQLTAIGGTSAVSPLYAALLARINQSLGTRVGYINPLLYAQAGGGAFRDITAGDNGAYPALAGWDACTGWGSPDGTRLRDLLGGGS